MRGVLGGERAGTRLVQWYRCIRTISCGGEGRLLYDDELEGWGAAAGSHLAAFVGLRCVLGC